MQEKYTREEYRKLVRKGRGFLMDYLKEIGEGAFRDNDSKDLLFSVISDEYKRLMREDEDFFRSVEEFCSQRRFRNEKNQFVRGIMGRMVSSGRIHREYARRDPDYSIPERYRA